jgi:hypothetical protein
MARPPGAKLANPLAQLVKLVWKPESALFKTAKSSCRRRNTARRCFAEAALWAWGPPNTTADCWPRRLIAFIHN